MRELVGDAWQPQQAGEFADDLLRPIFTRAALFGFGDCFLKEIDLGAGNKEEMIDAAEGYRLGAIERVVPRDQLRGAGHPRGRHGREAVEVEEVALVVVPGEHVSAVEQAGLVERLEGLLPTPGVQVQQRPNK